MSAYYTGHNVPGYLPMSDDEPYGHATFEAARDELLYDLLYAVRTAVGYNHDEQMAEACRNAAEEVNLWSSPDTIYVCTDEPHDLGLAFWIIQTDDDPTNESEA